MSPDKYQKDRERCCERLCDQSLLGKQISGPLTRVFRRYDAFCKAAQQAASPISPVKIEGTPSWLPDVGLQ